MITLAHPWALTLLLAPLLLRFVLPPRREERIAISVPFLEQLARLSGREPGPGAVIPRPGRIQQPVVWGTWLLLVLALTRPQWVEDPISRTVPTRDLLLAVDLSGSMETEDFADAGGVRTDRLSAAKHVLDDFLSRREGDRVGLVFFGSAAFVQAPFTEDLEVCRTLLDEAQVRMAGPRTVLGDAIGLAISLFEKSEVAQRVLIVLTDGNDTSSRVPPIEAARIASDRDITIHAVAMGDPRAAGEEELDEETLRGVASATGGGYFHAMDGGGLEEIYRRLDALDVREAQTLSHRPRRELFMWPLGAFLLLGAGLQAAFAVAFGVRARRA